MGTIIRSFIQEGCKIKSLAKFATKTNIAVFQGKSITVSHLTPVLSPEERAERKRGIEGQLYEVFVKYNKPNLKVN